MSTHGINPISPFINQDEEHLRLLWVYHAIVAVFLAVIWVFFTLLPLVLGEAYFHALQWQPPAYGTALKQILLVNLVGSAIQISVLGLNAWGLKQKRHWLNAVILSCIECLCMLPLGLLLGISAILVLRRPTVKLLFDANRAAQSPD